MFNFLLILACFFITSSQLFSQGAFATPLDSLLYELESAKEDTNKVYLLSNISAKYQTSDPKLGLEYAQKSLDLANELKFKNGLSGAYNGFGLNYYIMSDFPNAVKYYTLAREAYSESGDELGVAGISMNLGNIYSQQANFPKALEAFFKASQVFKELENYGNLAACLVNIGGIYKRQESDTLALEILLEALEYAEKAEYLYPQSAASHNIGRIYLNWGKVFKAKEMFNNAIEINTKMGYLHWNATNYSSLGLIHEKDEEFNKAFEYYFKSLELNEKMNNEYSLAVDKGNIGVLYIRIFENDSLNLSEYKSEFISTNKLENLNKSLPYLNEAIEISNRIGALEQLVLLKGYLSYYYKYKNNFKKAFTISEEYVKLKDSLNKNDVAKQIGKLEAEKLQMEKEYEAKEQARLEQEKVDRRNQMQYTMISVITVFFFAIIFYLMRKNISFGAIDVLTFIAFLLLFEFLLVLTEPWVDDFTNNVPIYKLLINIGLAIMLIPLQKAEQIIRAKVKQ